MWLEKSKERIAYWDTEKDCWFVGDNTLYKWQYPDGTDATLWFKDIRSAINWLIDYDTKTGCKIGQTPEP